MPVHSSPLRGLAASPYPLAGLLAVSGLLHVAVPGPYTAIVPPRLPSPTGLVYLSGAAELACAGALCVPRTRRLAGWATAALFVAVFPANVQMARDSDGRSAVYRAAVYARLPVQAPLVLWAAAIGRRGQHRRRSRPVSTS